jgi:hypothetical protein
MYEDKEDDAYPVILYFRALVEEARAIRAYHDAVWDSKYGEGGISKETLEWFLNNANNKKRQIRVKFGSLLKRADVRKRIRTIKAHAANVLQFKEEMRLRAMNLLEEDEEDEESDIESLFSDWTDEETNEDYNSREASRALQLRILELDIALFMHEFVD